MKAGYEDDDDLIDVSVPLGRLARKRAKLENQLEITMRDGVSDLWELPSARFRRSEQRSM